MPFLEEPTSMPIGSPSLGGTYLLTRNTEIFFKAKLFYACCVWLVMDNAWLVNKPLEHSFPTSAALFIILLYINIF